MRRSACVCLAWLLFGCGGSAVDAAYSSASGGGGDRPGAGGSSGASTSSSGGGSPAPCDVASAGEWVIGAVLVDHPSSDSRELDVMQPLDGGVVVSGSNFSGTTSLGGATVKGGDLYDLVARVDACGGVPWAQAGGGAVTPRPEVDGVVAWDFAGDLKLLGVDGAATSSQVPYPGACASGFAPGPGSLMLGATLFGNMGKAGSFPGPISDRSSSFGYRCATLAEGSRTTVFALAPNGHAAWLVDLTGSSQPSLAADDAHVAITGATSSAIDFGGVSIPAPAPGAGVEPYTIMLDAQGNALWGRAGVGGNVGGVDPRVSVAAFVAGGALALAGACATGLDVTWLDAATGATLADVCTKGGEPFVLAASTDGESVFVAGQFGDSDLLGAPVTHASRFLARVDHTGVRAQRVFPDSTYIQSIAPSADGAIACGGFSSSLTIGAYTVTTASAAGAWLGRFLLQP